MQPPEGHQRRRTPDPEAIAGNIRAWTRMNAEHTDERAESDWREEEITWGVFGVREASLNSPLGIVHGLDVVELGCGTAYISAWLAKRGARPVGIDPTPAQLASAKRAQAATGIWFPLIEASAEQVPIQDATFDLAVSEYGASLWADPALWVPEAARLLRPSGRLVFLTNSTLVYLCSPDEGLVGRALRRSQFDIEDLIEVQAPADAESPVYYDYVTAEWGRQWPAEEIWVTRKRS